MKCGLLGRKLGHRLGFPTANIELPEGVIIPRHGVYACRASVDGEWYMVDVTWDDPIPDVSGRKYYAYFNVTSDYLRVNHIWNEECFPECTAKKYNYFYYNDLVCKDVSGLKGKIDTLLSEKKNIEMQFRIENMGENISLQNIANQGNVREIAWQVEKAGPDGVIWVEIKGR